MDKQNSGSSINSIGDIAFIGAGKMATAIACGLLREGFPQASLRAYEVSDTALAHFHEATGGHGSKKQAEALSNARIVILSVKPQHIHEALAACAPLLKDKLLISIVAGVKLKTLTELSGVERVIRVMPNTPALVGAGISAYTPSPYVSSEDLRHCELIFEAVGAALLVPEHLMDAVTGLSGSGPAYVFDFIQGLADGGVAAGLPRDKAMHLATQTVLGAARLVQQSGTHPTVLRDQVISPGGTTAKGVAVLEKGSFRGLVAEAVLAAAQRSAELGQN
ncbi:MAG: pyrroline-5-carboxylate reductase [Lentisphaerae bacterium GWF2_52_8]|nr:MAG: pyrroline-5-carboxylate reductase [Lentisphaerae bacterium GWF2_52_8]